MSLRASVYSFNLQAVQSAFGSRDEGLRSRWKQAISGAFSDPKAVKHGEQIVDWLIDRPADALVPRAELEHMAITVHALATLDAGHAEQGQVFFEALFGHMTGRRSRIEWTDRYRPWFRNGRPLIAPVLDSGWSFYAYLTHEELKEFLQLAEEDVRIASFYSSEEGFAFLWATIEQGKDLWVFYS